MPTGPSLLKVAVVKKVRLTNTRRTFFFLFFSKDDDLYMTGFIQKCNKKNEPFEYYWLLMKLTIVQIIIWVIYIPYYCRPFIIIMVY